MHASRYSTEEQRVELLETVLKWGHLAPTAPDTLATYPFSESDPFILDAAPHVLFAGNQPEFATKVATGVCTSCSAAPCISMACLCLVHHHQCHVVHGRSSKPALQTCIVVPAIAVPQPVGL